MPGLVDDATSNDLTYRIIGAAMEVHNSLGPGYKEEIYEQALCKELRSRQIPVEDQMAVPVLHDGEQVGVFYLDMLVEGKVVVELKAFSH